MSPGLSDEYYLVLFDHAAASIFIFSADESSIMIYDT